MNRGGEIADTQIDIMSTENLVSNQNLLALTSVLEHAELPVTGELMDQIEGGL